MNKLTLLLIVALIFTGIVFAEDEYGYEPPFEWKSPEIVGQGSSFTANALGYDSLFTNPAGFKVSNGDFNLITIQPTWTMNPFAVMDELGSDSGEETTEGDIIKTMMDQVTTNSLGLGAQTSIGYVGHGLGLGFAVSADSYFPKAQTVLGARGQVSITAALIGGYAFNFNLLGIDFTVGADLRPMYRIKTSDIDLDLVTTIMDSEEGEDPDLSGIDVLSGTGLGIDAGLKAHLGWLTLGASLRDIGGTQFTYEVATGQDFSDGTQSTNSVPYEELIYKTPASLRLGASLHPYIPVISFLVDPVIHGEFTQYLVADDFYDDGWEQGSVWSRIDLGTEITVLKLLKLRAGYQGGYLTTGLGLKLWFIEVNASLYSTEGGTYAGNEPVLAGSMDVSLRF